MGEENGFRRLAQGNIGEADFSVTGNDLGIGLQTGVKREDHFRNAIMFDFGYANFYTVFLGSE